MKFLSILPTVLISRLMGVLVTLPAPAFLWQIVMRIYCRAYQVNLAEAEKPLEAYRNLSELFVRNLKDGSRPVGRGIVCPVDGTLRNYGPIDTPHLPQIKGRQYSLADLLGGSERAAQYRGGSFLNLYLSPRDYHQIHAPVAGSLRSVIYCPGRLLPVNDWSMGGVDNVFGINERVTLLIETPAGEMVAVSLIGALNVGKISLACAPELNRRIKASWFGGKGFTEHYQPGAVLLASGDRLGVFHLGSSVALLFPPGMMPLPELVEEPRSIKVGVSLQELLG